MYEAVSFVNELDKFNLIGTVDSTGDKRDSKSATEEDLRAAMLEDGQYTDIEKMFSVAPGLVQFRALKNGVPCLVKLTGAGDDESLLRLRSEWNVLETLRLAAIDGVSYPSSWSHFTNAVSIVFSEELANCRTLKELYLSRERVDDLDWLLLLKRIYSVCQTLSQCHLQDLRHGNIRPEVIMCKTSEADIHEVTYLCSWLYASKLVVESSYLSASVLNVSLPYVAPECTGRMNRNVDLRADLYSLGVTLYQIICLRLPFTGASKLEIMHKHISEAVVPPSNFLNVPPPVEMVILKLLKKMPEDRYQSADGLLFDLERIIHSLQDPAGNPLSDIQIGREDHASRFVVASEFVGRDQEILSLVSQFEAVRQDSQSRVVTIGGYSGVGKSRLVREFLSSVSESKVFYTECKFDQYKTFAPFATMKILLRDLLAQIFVEPPDILESWRLKIASALGQDAQAVCDICPDLVTLLTTDYLRSLPPTVPLGAIASEERIRRGMRALIQGFATKQHQLVIFVDDLQWSPAADLQIIMNIRERPNMLIICAYRDNEIGPDHMVKTMFIDNVRPNLCLSLEALSPYCTAQLVCATLHRPVPSGPELSESDRCLQELVDLIQVRSQGNCFFISQILQSLYRSKLLTYDYKKKTWTWGMRSVQALEMSDDVVCLVIRQVTTLSGSCQDILKVASCLGNSGFRLEFLEKATSRSRSEIAKELFGAMSIGLVVAVDDNYKSALALENSDMWSNPRPASEEDRLGQSKILESSLPSLAPGKELGGDLAVSYRFLHDRVQQAVYALVDDTDKPALHLAIGMALLDAYGEVLTDTMLFDICSQVNKGAHLVQGIEQRLSMAWLNLRAARIAFGNTANRFAFELLQHVSEYLIGDLWQYGTKLAETFYDLMEEVCASLTQYDKALAAASEILERTQNSVTRIRMYNKKMKILVSKGSVSEALSTGAAGLLEAGIDFGQYVAGNIDEKQISEIADRLWEEIPLGLSSVDDLRSMPFIEDDHLIAATDLLVSMFPPLFLYRPSLAAVLALSGVKLSMSKGLGAYSCYFMSFLSMMLCEADNPRCDFISARAYCEAAEELLGELMKGNQRYTEKAPATLTLVGCTYSFTRDPRIDGKRAFDWAIELSQRCFDGEYIAYALGNNAITRLFSGENLRTLVPESRRHIAAVESYKRPVGSFYVLPVLQTITNFVQHKNSRDMYSLSGTLLRDEAEALSFIQDGHLLLHQVYYWASKLVCAVLCNDQDAALKAVNEGAKVINGVSGVPAKVYFETFSLLVLADNLHCQRPLSNDLTNYLDVILAHIDVWSKQNPSQFGAWQYISTAEIRKHSGSLSWVLEQYNLAIDIVTTAKNYLLMGLFNERCARYLLAKGHGVRVAYGFLSEAMRSYLTWGCHAKVNMIATEFGLEDSSTPQLYQEDAKTDSAYSEHSDNLLAACHLKASSKAGSRMQTKTNSTPSLQGPHDILMTKIPNSSVSEVSLSHHHNGIELQTGSASNSAEMDLATVIENSLLLSKALHTTDVIGQLLKHLLQVAGAQAGALISDVHQDQHFMLVATAHVDQVQLYKDMSLEAADHLIPVELIRLAANSKRCIIDERKYMRKRLEVTTQQISEPTPKSFMALPVILSGKVMAVAYLSHDQVSNLFTERKVELLTILAAQAAVALEKGRIYTELKRANAELSENKKSLEHQTERLEAIVRERTGQLQKQNDVLTSEITQRTSIEAELVQAKDTAEQATAMKSRFLAMMSHEMRTPFNAVIGFSTLLLDTHLTSEQKDMTQSIVDASTDLIAIINDILDFSKIENDKMNLDPIWFDLRPMTESTLEVVARDAGSKDIILGYFEGETKSGTWIYADNTRLRQCVLNLLSNAVKFTPEEGTVSVTSSISKLGEANEDGDSEVLLKIVVQDSGIGIAAEDQTKLFQFFSQVDDSITRRFGGTGLGLAISHKICRLFGGDLTVDSEPGKGSSFTATFKVKVNMEKHPPEETNSKILQTKRCLVLEPFPLLGKNIQGHLNAFGMRSIVRANLESVQATGDQCDVAIIGHSFNQPETIRAIRAMGLHIHRLPLVVLMPFGATLPQQPDQKDLDSIDAVLSAPIRRMRLFRSLQSVFPVETGVPRFAKPTKDNLKTITNPGETFPRKDISILLVEDNLVNIKVATQLLKRSGYVPKVAHDGIEAVATCANEYFDLILMDLSMPRMGGLDATREIRAIQLTEGKPFICAMTANAMASDKERCLEAGMNDYITKPVMLPQLIAVLDKVRDRISGTSENCQKLEADADHEEQKEHQIKDKKEGHRRDSLQAGLGTDLNREDSSGTSLPTLSRVS